MTKKKIIVLTLNKFDKRDHIRFGVELLAKNGFVVDVVDLSEWLRSKHYCQTYNPLDEIKDTYVTKVAEKGQFENILRAYDLSSLFALCYLPLYPDTKPVFKIISRFSIPYAIFRFGTVPTPSSKFRILAGRLKYYLKYNILSNDINAASVAFMAGRKSQFELGAKINKKTRIINIGSTDYNTFQKFQRSEAKKDSPHIVFIDVNYPCHPDDEGLQFLHAETYYYQINTLLRKYVTHFKVSCGVAVHPRTGNLEKNPYDFQIFKDSTPELVKNAKLVIAHYSTSLSYAVLNYKPIILLGVKSIENLIYGKYEKKFAKELGLKIKYIDKDYDVSEPTIVNVKKYKRYINNYIIDESCNIPNKDLPAALLTYLNNLVDVGV